MKGNSMKELGVAGVHSKVYVVFGATTEEVVDEISNVLSEGGYLNENGCEISKREHCLILNGGEMKSTVRVVERILETFADSIERFSMLFLGKGSDGEFALYEFDGTVLREFDDMEIQEVVRGFSWEKLKAENLGNLL